MQTIYRTINAVLCRLIMAALAVTMTAAGATAADRGKYTSLINSVAKIPSERVIRIGDKYMEKDMRDDALVIYMTVCDRAADDMPANERHACVEAGMKAGDIYYDRGDYARSLEFYVEALKLSEEGGDGYLAAMLYKNIGNVYCQYSDFERGVAYFKKGYDCCKTHPDADTERRLLVNLTGLYINLGRLTEAGKFLKKTEQANTGGDSLIRFMNNYNRGLIESAAGHYAKAAQTFTRLAAFAAASGFEPKYECYAYQELYKVFMKTGDNVSALHYLDICLSKAAASGISHLFTESLRDASTIHERMGQRDKALELKSQYIDLKDSVLNVRRFDAAKNVQFRYEMEKVNNEISSLRLSQIASRQTIARQRAVMLLTLGAAIVVTVFVVVLYRQNKKLHASYAHLYALNRDFMSRQEQMNRRHTADLGRIVMLESKAGAAPPQPDTPQGGEPETGNRDDNRKYRTSNLDDTRQQTLAAAITAVMENTDEYCSPDFSLDRLAALVGSNSKYVSQVINGTYNRNFSNYVNEYRIRKACERLSDQDNYGKITVKAIGESVGYRSHATFVGIFRRQTGLTPSLYQKMARGNS